MKVHWLLENNGMFNSYLPIPVIPTLTTQKRFHPGDTKSIIRLSR